MFFLYLLLAISTSIDSIAIGITYGVRNIEISKNAKLILFTISFIISTIAILIGKTINNFLSTSATKVVSAIVLSIMGIFLIFQTLKENKEKIRIQDKKFKEYMKNKRKNKNEKIFKNKEKNNKEDFNRGNFKIKSNKKENNEYEKIYKFFIETFCITIKIIKNPIVSDLDFSKKIDEKEAIYLSLALSLDSFSIGIGSGIVGKVSLILPVLVALIQIIFLSIGRKIGSKIIKASNISMYNCNFIAGILLIVIGIIRAF